MVLASRPLPEPYPVGGGHAFPSARRRRVVVQVLQSSQRWAAL